MTSDIKIACVVGALLICGIICVVWINRPAPKTYIETVYTTDGEYKVLHHKGQWSLVPQTTKQNHGSDIVFCWDFVRGINVFYCLVRLGPNPRQEMEGFLTENHENYTPYSDNCQNMGCFRFY